MDPTEEDVGIFEDVISWRLLGVAFFVAVVWTWISRPLFEVVSSPGPGVVGDGGPSILLLISGMATVVGIAGTAVVSYRVSRRLASPLDGRG